MEWRKGDVINVAKAEGCNAIAFTANSVVKPVAGVPHLVMGAGAARRIRDSFPSAAALFGAQLAERSPNPYGVQPDYHLLSVAYKNWVVMAIQVKRDYQDDGVWDLTQESLRQFSEHVRASGLRVAMNCPLVKHGGYADREIEVRMLVEEAIEGLDVFVCTV